MQNHKKMLKVGITGGIGSGKTTVSKIFESIGIPVYYADDRAKALMTGDRMVKRKIIDLFGVEAYFRNGRLNRKYISSIVFEDKSKLEALNGIVHPSVALDGKKWFDVQVSKNFPYAIKEAALLIESGSYKELDHLILVSAPLDIRIKRVVKRDKTNIKAVEARISKQMPDEQKKPYCNLQIINDGNTPLIPQVIKIHQWLIGL
jgi:dephospho-CoA kinase